MWKRMIASTLIYGASAIILWATFRQPVAWIWSVVAG